MGRPFFAMCGGRFCVSAKKKSLFFTFFSQNLVGSKNNHYIYQCKRNAKTIKDMEKQNTNTIEFKVGTTYVMGWIGDSDLKTPFKVIKRTKCFVTLEDPRNGETVRAKVSTYQGVETCYPTGQYSMAPSLYADKVQQPEVEKPVPVEVMEAVAPKRLAPIIPLFG